MIDEDGYAYYVERIGGPTIKHYYIINKDLDKYMRNGLRSVGPGWDHKWYWDDNQYELMVEEAVTKIEILELKYGDVNYTNTTSYRRDDLTKSISTLPNHTNTTSMFKLALEMLGSISKAWTHTRQLGVKAGHTIEVNSRFSLVKSRSYVNTWVGLW